MLKKLPALQLAVVLFAAAFAVVMGACPEDNFIVSGRVFGIQEPGSPDTGNPDTGEPDTGGSQTPTLADYSISDNLTQIVGSVTAVTVTAKSGRSPGAVTVYYEGTDGTDYDKTQTLPEETGSYDVTFDVAAAEGWLTASNLLAGILVIGDPTPAATDFDIDNLNQLSNNITAVIISPKSGKSRGTITIYYDGLTTIPSTVGTYAVIFDVAAAEGWKAATGLSAGDLIIGDPSKSTPVAADYNISNNLNQTAGSSVSAVTVTAKAGKSPGAITVHYEGTDGTDYHKSTVLPTQAGTYAVTFDVTAAGNWNAASSLHAGVLSIKATPVAGDFDISSNLNQTEGNTITAVTVTPKSGKSPGMITVHYEGTGYPKSANVPSTAGTYTVTFDVAASGVWNAASGLAAGTLVITAKSTPVAADYDISSNLTQTVGSVTAVTVTAKTGKSPGAVTVHYTGTGGTSYAKSTTVPSAAGTYTVTFDVAASGVWNSAAGLTAGTLTVTATPTPVAADYNISANLTQTAGSVTAVTVTAKAGKSPGAVTVYYTGTDGTSYAKNTTVPSTAGTYTVTFDVAAASNWNAATGLAAGTLTINAASGGGDTAKNYMSGSDALSWGNSSSASVLTLGLTPGNDTTQVNLNWYSSGSASSKTAKVRFVKGTFTAGTKLIEVTGPTVTSASSGNAQHKATVTGLEAGSSYQYAVSSDGTNWSKEYNFKVPAATGAFKFAVITDPQLNANVDSISRYTPSPGTTAQGWKETMDKVIAAGVSFIASCGDQVDTNNNETQYTNFFAPDGIKSLPLAPVIGNHDPAINFFYHFNIPNEQGTANSTGEGANYYYHYNNILFVVLNTSAYPGSTAAAQPYINRFRTTIQNAKTAHAGKYDWLIVQHHKSTASVASHCADTDIQYYVEAGFETLMSDQKVDFVLAGHDHVYARSYPLKGMDGGKVSVPNKTNNSNTFNNPGDPIYLTFNTASGLKYYLVSADKTTTFSSSGVVNNAKYPYTGTDANGTPTSAGSVNYIAGNLPVSNLAFSQALIPSYTIVDVNGRSITFKTYPIATRSGTSNGVAWSFDANTAYDWVTVTK